MDEPRLEGILLDGQSFKVVKKKGEEKKKTRNEKKPPGGICPGEYL